MNADVSAYGPAPLQTPILANDGSNFGIPFHQREDPPRGDVHIAWQAWFNVTGERLSIAILALRGSRISRTGPPDSIPAAKYPPGTIYTETDTGLTYVVRSAAGVVNTAGTTVNWVLGDQFSSALVGSLITINGLTYTIATFVSATQITLTSSAGVQAGVAYSSALLQWFYSSGTQSGAYTALPVGYTALDVGAPFFDITHWRAFVWSAVGGAPSSTSPGWMRGFQELPTAATMILPFGPGTSPGLLTGWVLCNGSNVSITRDDASTTTITTVNFASGSYPKGGTTGTYGPTGAVPNPAVLPTISGSVSVDTTSPSASVLSSGAVIALPGDPVSNVVVPFYVKR